MRCALAQIVLFERVISPASEAKRITGSREYRPLESKILAVFSASSVPFFPKLAARARFQDPPDWRGQRILLAAQWKRENVWGGHLVWSGED